MSPCTKLLQLNLRVELNDELSGLSLCILGAILSFVPRTAPLEKVRLMFGNSDELEDLEMATCERPLQALDEALHSLPKLKKVTLRSVLNDLWEEEDDVDSILFQRIIERLPNVRGKKGLRLGYIGDGSRMVVV